MADESVDRAASLLAEVAICAERTDGAGSPDDILLGLLPEVPIRFDLSGLLLLSPQAEAGAGYRVRATWGSAAKVFDAALTNGAHPTLDARTTALSTTEISALSGHDQAQLESWSAGALTFVDVRRRGRLVAQLGLLSRHPLCLSGDERAYLSALTQNIGQALARLRTHEEVEQARHRLDRRAWRQTLRDRLRATAQDTDAGREEFTVRAVEVAQSLPLDSVAIVLADGVGHGSDGSAWPAELLLDADADSDALPEGYEAWRCQLEQGHRARVNALIVCTTEPLSRESATDLRVWGEALAEGLAQRATRQGERRRDAVASSILAQLDVGIGLLDREGTFVLTNNALRKMLGPDVPFWPATLRDILPDGAAPTLFQHVTSTGTGGMKHAPIRRQDGSTFEAEIRGFPVEIGGEFHVVGFLRDVTVERKATKAREDLERELRHTRRMESLGRLAGGIAHDFNNLLMVMLMHCEMASESLEQDHPAMEDILGLAETADRAATLTRHLLTFGRGHAPSPGSVDLCDIMASAAQMLARVFPTNMVLETVPVQDALVSGDAGDLEQAVVNLCMNARDAIGEGHRGRIIIRIERVELGLGDRILDAGRWLILSVTDNGSGMTPETVERAFEPFYTTKGDAKGTGLGLATVYGTARQHGGVARIHSVLGKGTRCELWLPESAERPAAQMPQAVTPENTEGTETVLLAEDLPALRTLFERTLTAAGFDTIAVADGRAAVEAYRNNPSIQLVILDVIMPTMGGREAYEAIVDFDPDARVLFMSGYTGEALPTQFLESNGLQLLRKPFAPVELLRSARKVLDEDRP